MDKVKKQFPEALAEIKPSTLWQRIMNKIRGGAGRGPASNAVAEKESGVPLPPAETVAPVAMPPALPREARVEEAGENDEVALAYQNIFPHEQQMTLFVGNRSLIINDFYCLNRACRCHEATVEFEYDDAEHEERLAGLYLIDYQSRTWNDIKGLPDGLPVAALRAMTENQIPDFYRILEARHQKKRQLPMARHAGTQAGGSKSKKKRRKKNKR